MPLDANKYRPYLDRFDLTEVQKTAMIEALWSIAETVSELAWGTHSSQLVRTANDNDSLSDSSVVEFFRSAANDPVLDELADALQRLETEADDRSPATTTKRRESAET
jgi:hypothetical protein